MRRNLHAGGNSYNGFSLNVMSEDDLYKVHLDTLEILDTVGIFCESRRAMEIFEAGGCRVDLEKNLTFHHLGSFQHPFWYFPLLFGYRNVLLM